MKLLAAFLFGFFCYLNTNAQQVDTLDFYAPSLKRNTKVVVVKPEQYKKKKKEKFAVVYLLHGYSGAYNNWIIRVPNIKNLATENNLIIVCPDGGFSSWYINDASNDSLHYDDYFSKDLINKIDQTYRTKADRKFRAITGLSMGGHGALLLTIKHPDLFGAAGSMSGAIDFTKMMNRFDIYKRVGDTIDIKNWQPKNVATSIQNLAKDSIPLIIDCGWNDFLIEHNRALHKKLIELNIKHDYIERIGGHSWDYWRNAVIYQMYFFRKVFETNSKL